MNNSDHNNTKRQGRTGVATLGDLYEFIRASDLSAAQKSQVCSAIKRVDELVGHGALDLVADPRLILARLETFSPAMAGMTSGSFANLKSRLRQAFRLANTRLVHPRSRPQLQGAWRALQERLGTGGKRVLSRLFHFAARQGWQPEDITDAHIDRFAAHLRDEAMVVHWEDVVRNTIREWNRVSGSAKHASLRRLTLPLVKRTRYWIPFEQWPEGLRADVEALLLQLLKQNPFRGKKVRKRKPSTVQQYRHTLSTLISAEVRNGVPMEALPRLADALAPDHVAGALGYLATRSDGKITATMINMMIRVRVLAGMCGLPPEQRDELEAIWKELEEDAPPERQRRSMAPKNRALLDRLEHDPQFASLIHNLPNQLAAEARSRRNYRNAGSLMRTALAVDLLLTCSMRRENLIRLKLGQSIKRVGQAPAWRWVIELTPEEVKNEQALRFELVGPTASLLEEYLAKWRPTLAKVPSDWLFPGPDGGAIDPRTMAADIQRQSERVLGVAISPHQFRHISAESFLLLHPDKLDLISDHLGHRDRNTTRRYYARSKQKQASRVYQEHVLKVREEADRHLSRRGRKRRRSDLEAAE